MILVLYLPSMTGSEIRTAFHRQRLQKFHKCPHTVVIDELGLLNGGVRADIAIVNGSLIGFEIKGHKDDLSRLDRQISGYDAIFDKSWVVTAPKFTTKLLQMLPPHWGIIEILVHPTAGPTFRSFRDAARNPYVNPISLAGLLWKAEMSALLQLAGVDRPLRERREKLCQLIAENASLAQLRTFVRQRLRDRKDWRYRKQPSRYDGLCRSNARCLSYPAQFSLEHI